MTRDDIIRMAREAELASKQYQYDSTDELEWQALERFATLVAAAEREACAKVCESCWFIDGTDTANGFAAAIRARSNHAQG